MTLLIGADPELFLHHKGKPFSAFGLLRGTKYEPEPVTLGAVQVDGMALEFNIAPAKSPDEFIYHIETVMLELRRMIPKKYDFAIEAVADFDKQHMDEQPDVAKMLGCDPDFNAYTGTANDRPNQHPTIRAAGGHFHVGWTENADQWEPDHFDYCCQLTKQMDFHLGLPSVLLDQDTQRKQMYGKAGAFRPKPYGLEYRVLSNFWIKDKKLMRLMYENACLAYNRMREGDFLHEEYGDVQSIINSNDKDAAAELCEKAGIPVDLQ